jgi:DNA polymerase-3 subunit alpha
MSIIVLPPDINKSKLGFTIEPHSDSLEGRSIRFGFSAVKNVGWSAIEAILEARTSKDFASVSDFCARVDNRKANKKVIESLVLTGSFDQFGTRSAIIQNLETIRHASANEQEKKASGQFSLFDTKSSRPKLLKDHLPDIPEFPKKTLLTDEKKLLGVYLSDHPLNDALKSLEAIPRLNISDLDVIHQDKKVTIGGVLSGVRHVLTRASNKEMAFGKVEDTTGSIEVVIFPKTYEKTKSSLIEDVPVIIKGTADISDERRAIIVTDINIISSHTQKLSFHENIISIPRGTQKSILKQIGDILKNHPGSHQIEIHIENGGPPKVLKLPYQVDYNHTVQKQIQSLLTLP